MGNKLNPRQKEAVQAPSRPLLVVAGAGTGKTRTLTRRLARLIQAGIPGNLICALTFTNKAAKEMQSRLETLTGHGISQPRTPFVGTFHSLGAYVLKREASFFRRTPKFVIYDNADSIGILKKILKFNPEWETISPPAAFRFINTAKNGVAGAVKSEKKMEEIFYLYEKSLEDKNAFDLDDLIAKPVLGFGKSEEMLERYKSKFKYFLVDEYQDINPAQYEIIRLLAGQDGNLTAVGDEDQTIYSWRGSTIDIFLNFQKDWKGGRIIVLREHYRSTSNIIEAATSVAANNTRRLSLGDKRLFTSNPPGAPVVVAEFGSESEEAAWVNKQLENLPDGESAAVLYRTNAQSRAIEQEFLESRVPYRIFGGPKFYDRLEVKDALAALRYAYNRKDELSRDRLRKTFRAKAFPAIEKTIADNSDDSPAKLLEKFLAISNYGDHLEKHFTNAEERKENISELMNFANEFGELGDFLEHVSLAQSSDKPSSGNLQEGKGFFINLMTVHAAKGLEFDHVFIVGCAEGLLPHSKSIYPPEVEEERRLMYVAMTRARKNLNISFYGIPSRFISEIPESLTRVESNARRALDFDSEERYITYD